MTIDNLIQKLALAQASADAARTSGSLHYIPATTVEILDTARDAATGRTTAWFIFDFVILHSAQSGSDWYNHHVFAGSATILDDKVLDSKLERLREDNVTEHAMEWAPQRYDHDRVRSADRDAWWAKTKAARGRQS